MSKQRENKDQKVPTPLDKFLEDKASGYKPPLRQQPPKPMNNRVSVPDAEKSRPVLSARDRYAKLPREKLIEILENDLVPTREELEQVAR